MPERETEFSSFKKFKASYLVGLNWMRADAAKRSCASLAVFLLNAAGHLPS